MERAGVVAISDCRQWLASLPENSADAIVTDPPYELGFMGKKWDHTGIAYDPETWAACLRVLKPGGHMLAFGGSRTYHRIACAIEDAGFHIRDTLQWLYGTGFPKSLNVAKQPDCESWEGWGTALKPAYEPIVMARKPLAGTVAANVLEYGTGGINVDGCRIATDENLNGGAYSNGTKDLSQATSFATGVSAGEFVQPPGRWPANVILDPEAAAMLDAQTGTLKAGVAVKRNGVRNDNPIAFAGPVPPGTPDIGYADTGGASRFFYTAKASKSEREAGLVHFQKATAGELTDRKDGSDGLKSPRAGAGRTSNGRANKHPTVKPIALMRYLCRLVTPPGGLILDPFTGSGTTGCAALLEGFRFQGCEQSAEYAEIAEARIAHWRDAA